MEVKGQFWELFLCFHPMSPEFPTSIPVCGLFFVFYPRDCVYVTLADLELPM